MGAKQNKPAEVNPAQIEANLNALRLANEPIYAECVNDIQKQITNASKNKPCFSLELNYSTNEDPFIVQLTMGNTIRYVKKKIFPPESLYDISYELTSHTRDRFVFGSPCHNLQYQIQFIKKPNKLEQSNENQKPSEEGAS